MKQENKKAKENRKPDKNKQNKIVKDSRKFRYGTNATVLTVVIVVAVVLINFVFVSLNDKIPLSLDLTKDQITKLTDETISTLKTLDQDITVKYFTTEEQKNSYVEEMLSKYQQKSGHIKVETIDPVANPTVTKQYQENNSLVSMNSVVFELGDRYKTVDSSKYFSYASQDQSMTAINVEKEFTNAIVYLLSDKMPKALMTTGHGEQTMTTAKENLEDMNYEVADINLMNEDIPLEDSVVIISAPTNDFTAEEIDKLDKYLDQGGNVQVYFDPQVGSASVPRLESYLADEWGVTRVARAATETDRSKLYSFYGQIYLSTASMDSSSDVLGDVASSSVPVVLAPSNPLSLPATAPGGVVQTTLLSLSNTAIAKLENNASLEKEEGDEEGPFDVMVAATKTTYNDANEAITGKVVVSGSLLSFDTFAIEGQFANYDLFRSVAGWMLESKELTSISPRISRVQTVTIPESHVKVWFVVLMVVVPVAILAAGLLVWRKRRYR